MIFSISTYGMCVRLYRVIVRKYGMVLCDIWMKNVQEIMENIIQEDADVPYKEKKNE